MEGRAQVLHPHTCQHLGRLIESEVSPRLIRPSRTVVGQIRSSIIVPHVKGLHTGTRSKKLERMTVSCSGKGFTRQVRGWLGGSYSGTLLEPDGLVICQQTSQVVTAGNGT